MKKTEKNLYLLYMLFGVLLVTANCIASKVWNTGIPFLGGTITLTIGVISYPFTFLCTDIIGEVWGKEKANLAVKYGFIAQLVSTAMIVIARYATAVDQNVQDAYVTLLGQQWVFVVASLVAYFISQSLDVKLFHVIRDGYIAKHGSTKGGKWIWNNVATITSQLVDSIVYAGIAFGLGSQWLFQAEMRPVLFGMILGQWLFKTIVAICDTPLFYLFTRKSNKHVAEAEEAWDCK